MDPHLKLLARVLVDKRTAIDRVFFNLGRQGNRTLHLAVITAGGINNLLDRSVKNLVLVSRHSNSDLLDILDLSFLGSALALDLDLGLLDRGRGGHSSLSDNLGHHAGADGLAALTDGKTLFGLERHR